MSKPGMTSPKPYLLRSIYEWIADNDLTPYIMVDATMPHVDVPQEFIKDGQIVLNISMMACRDINMGQEALDFKARFRGVPRHVYVPINAILAIYSHETGQGMAFEVKENASIAHIAVPLESLTPITKGEPVETASEKQDSNVKPLKKKKGKAHLKVIK